MSKWSVTTTLIPGTACIDIVATRTDPEPRVVRKLEMRFSKPPTPEELRQSIRDYLTGEEKRLPADADYAHAAKEAGGVYEIGVDPAVPGSDKTVAWCPHCRFALQPSETTAMDGSPGYWCPECHALWGLGPDGELKPSRGPTP